VSGSRILGEQFGEVLVRAGVIDGDIGTYHRIVIDAKAGKAVMVYAERFADDRWLNVATGLTGIEVTARPLGAFVVDNELLTTGRARIDTGSAFGGVEVPAGCTCTHRLTGDGRYLRGQHLGCPADHVWPVTDRGCTCVWSAKGDAGEVIRTGPDPGCYWHQED
jgi:hypothetical protein